MHTCHNLPPSEIDGGLFLAVFTGSEGEHLFHRIGWKGRIWQLCHAAQSSDPDPGERGLGVKVIDSTYTYVYIYIYIHIIGMYVYTYIYIHIYIYRERER